jgi:hypothetical protein
MYGISIINQWKIQQVYIIGDGINNKAVIIFFLLEKSRWELL